MDYSFEDGDNFIRNAVTVRVGGAHHAPLVARKTAISRDLPIDIDDVMHDLRVDAASDEKSVENMARAACALIERKTGFVLLAGSYEVEVPSWWRGPLELNRGPLKAVTSIAYLSAANTWTDVDLSDFHVDQRERSFTITTLGSFPRPALWAELQRVRIRFDAGFAPEDDSASDAGIPIDDGLRTMLLMLASHFYENRQLYTAGQMETVEAGAAGLLGSYRQFW